MRNHTSVLQKTADAMCGQEVEELAILSADAEEELMHLQADGFWGPDIGFEAAEKARQHSRQNLYSSGQRHRCSRFLLDPAN